MSKKETTKAYRTLRAELVIEEAKLSVFKKILELINNVIKLRNISPKSVARLRQGRLNMRDEIRGVKLSVALKKKRMQALLEPTRREPSRRPK